MKQKIVPLKLYLVYSLETKNASAFESIIKQILIEPKQIIRPGDLKPNTNLPFKDPDTGGPLKTFSWVIGERYKRYNSESESSKADFDLLLNSFLDRIQIYRDLILEFINKDGKNSFDISFFVSNNFSSRIVEPLIKTSIWQKMALLKADMGFSYYQEFENVDQDNDDDDFEIEEKFSLEIHSKPQNPLSKNEKETMNQAQFHLGISQTGDQIYILNTSDWFENGRDESINNHIDACEIFLDTQFEQLYPIISQNHNQIILRRNTTYFSLGTLFSAKMISYLARLNMNLLFIDTSLEKPKDRYLSKG